MANFKLWHLVKLLFTLSLISLCVYLTDFGLVAQTLKNIDPGIYFFAFISTFLGTILLPAAVTKLSLSASKIDISFLRLLSINLSVRFYILVLPRAAATGIRWYHYQKNSSGYEAAALILFERIIQVLIVSAMGASFLVFDLNRLGLDGYLLMGILSAITILLTCVTLMFLTTKLERPAIWVQSQFPRLPTFASSWLSRLFSAIRDFRNVRRIDIWKIFGLSIAAYSLFIFSAWILLEELGVGVDIQTLIWIRSVVFILTLIPISVGGIGIRDVSIIYYLSFFGVSQEQGFAFSLALLGVQLVLGIWGGLIELLQALLKLRRSFG